VYKALSEIIRAAVAAQGDNVLQSVAPKAARAVKREILTLVGTFVGLAEDLRSVAANFVPPLLGPVLGDFAASEPAARDAIRRVGSRGASQRFECFVRATESPQRVGASCDSPTARR
jgi:hypothetical protein